MGRAAYATVVERVGTSTAFSGETMSATSVTNQYQIDDTAKRVWDRGATFTFFEDSVDVTADVDTIDYVFGKVTFKSSKTGDITVDGQYLPRQAIAGANSYSLDHEGDILDDTEFNPTGGYRTKMYGLRDVQVSVERWYPLNKHYHDALTAGDILVVSIQPGGANSATGEYARGFFRLDTAELSGDVSALEQESLSFMLDNDPDVSYAWGT